MIKKKIVSERAAGQVMGTNDGSHCPFFFAPDSTWKSVTARATIPSFRTRHKNLNFSVLSGGANRGWIACELVQSTLSVKTRRAVRPVVGSFLPC